MEVTCYVGIDVAKDRLDVHIRPQAKAFAVTNDAKGIADLAEALGTFNVERVVLEASGGYETASFTALAESGLVVAVVNPRQVRDFAKGAGKLA